MYWNVTENMLGEPVFFVNIYNHYHKWLAILIATIGSIILTAVFVYSIEYEKDLNNRTLLSQLYTSCAYAPLAWNLIVHPFTSLRFIIGPMNNHFLCNMDSHLRNAIPIYPLILLTLMPILRYLYLFRLKNPYMVRDEFWCFFITLWSAFISILSQIIFVLSPGKNPINYYMCMGHYHKEYAGVPVKKNLPFMFIAASCIIVNVVVISKITLYKLKIKVFTESMYTLTFNLVCSMVIISSFISPQVINSYEPFALDKYPHFYFVHFQFFYLTTFDQAVMLAVIFTNNPRMSARLRNSVVRWFQDLPSACHQISRGF